MCKYFVKLESYIFFFYLKKTIDKWKKNINMRKYFVKIEVLHLNYVFVHGVRPVVFWPS